MTKPVITNRVTQGTALTYQQLDTNFSNLQNATFGVTDGTNTHDFNLNDRITFTAGTNISLSVNSSTGAVTINGSAGSNFNPASPGAIGGTTPAAGTFTQLTANNGLTSSVSTNFGGVVVINPSNRASSLIDNIRIGQTSPHYGRFLGVSGTSLYLEGTNYSNDTRSIQLSAGTLSASLQFTLPTTYGSANQVLTTNGSGTLTWSTPSGGGSIPSQLTLVYNSGSGTITVKSTSSSDTLVLGELGGSQVAVYNTLYVNGKLTVNSPMSFTSGGNVDGTGRYEPTIRGSWTGTLNATSVGSGYTVTFGYCNSGLVMIRNGTNNGFAVVFFNGVSNTVYYQYESGARNVQVTVASASQGAYNVICTNTVNSQQTISVMILSMS